MNECFGCARMYYGTVPGLDMISIGPTVVKVHTPDERLEIASVQKLYDLLLATLRRVSEK